MDRLPLPSGLNLTRNLAENWRRFEQQYDAYAVASGVASKGDKVQGMTLLHVKNVTYERHSFNTRSQKEGEPVDAFVTELKQKASVCEFGELRDSLIRHRIVYGIRSDTVCARLLREQELTLQSVIDICRAAEVSESQLREMGDEKNVHAVRDKKQRYTQKDAQPQHKGQCKYCGLDHRKGPDHCPAYGKSCNKCNQKNHFAVVCKSKMRTHPVKHRNPRKAKFHHIEESCEDSDDDFFMYSIDTHKDDDWTVKLLVNDAKPINFKIDTGAQCNVMSLKACKYANIDTKQLMRSNSKLVSYSGHAVKACGKVLTSVRHKDQYFLLEIQIVDDDVQPVLGLKSSIDLKLKNRVHTVKKNQSTKSAEGLLKEYDHLFHGIGCLPGNMTSREHYPLKTVEEVAANLKHAKHFTTLDAASGFYQIQLTEESSWLATFNTPFGRFNFERLPFGISSAPEVFQRAMSHVFENQPCEVIADDILIWADSEQEHLEKLSQILKRAEDVGLLFKKDKCKVNKSEVEYVGHVFSSDGVKPSGEKIKAILAIPAPENKKELQRFMGMINYLGKFIPNLSTRNQSLRQLLETDVAWHWSEEQEKAFNDLKGAITSTPTLKYFDVNEDVKLSVDASS
ncbi:uncharacterized protein LOC134250729 [Saccostrea cucullata]|uniref:uncharacterized protein LOC134250729 n=1 Tax=Saccostrea cuccullata TaxID=36930 RepID=UPI002ED19376